MAAKAHLLLRRELDSMPGIQVRHKGHIILIKERRGGRQGLALGGRQGLALQDDGAAHQGSRGGRHGLHDDGALPGGDVDAGALHENPAA